MRTARRLSNQVIIFTFVAATAMIGCKKTLKSGELVDYDYTVCDKNNMILYFYEYQTQRNGPPIPNLVNQIRGDCEPSLEGQGTTKTISPVVRVTRTQTLNNEASTPQSSNLGPTLVNTFQYLLPWLFGPSLPDADIGKIRPDCPGDSQAYLVQHSRDSVQAFGLCPARLIKDIPVAPNPLQVAITPDATLALVTSYDGFLTFIDTATNTVKATLDLINYNPSGIDISPDSSRAYLTHYLDISPSLVIVDIPNRKILSTIALPFVYPRQVTLTPDGSQAWVNYYGGGVVTVIDLMTSTIAGSVNIGQLVDTGIAFHPTGTKAYVAVQPNQFYVIDTATLTIKTKIGIGQAPLDVIVSSAGDLVWVNSETDPGIWWIDTAQDKLLRVTRPANVQGGSMGMLVYP